jgi:hypothetical protein
MVRYFAPLLLLLIGLPAWAQRCALITTEATPSMIIAYIDRAKASDMSIETGPFTATLQIDPAAKKAGYATREGTTVGLYLYRVGHSVDGKDWREAGSVTSDEAGFAFDWPRFFLKGKPVGQVRVEVKIAKLSEAGDIWATRPDSKRDGAIFPFVDELETTRGFSEIIDGLDEFDRYDVQEAWADAVVDNSFIDVVFRDANAKAIIARARLAYPTFEDKQAKLVSVVNALRQAYATKQCPRPANANFTIRSDNALALVSPTPFGDLLYFIDEKSIVRTTDSAGHSIVTVWSLAANTKDQSKEIGSAAGMWVENRFDCTTRMHWPKLHFAYVDAAGRTYNPGYTEAGKAAHMWKFSALDYQAGIVCGSYQTDATRLTVAAALKAARSAPAKPKQ